MFVITAAVISAMVIVIIVVVDDDDFGLWMPAEVFVESDEMDGSLLLHYRNDADQ